MQRADQIERLGILARQAKHVPAGAAVSSRLARAAKKLTDWCNRSESDGVESSAIPLIDAHAAVCFRVLPPGPRASPRRNISAASEIPRNRWIARVSRASWLRSRSGGRRDRMSSQSESGRDARFCTSARNRNRPRREKLFPRYVPNLTHMGQSPELPYLRPPIASRTGVAAIAAASMQPWSHPRTTAHAAEGQPISGSCRCHARHAGSGRTP